MVRYWKDKDAVEAKLIKTPEGHTIMYMEGEKYPFPGHPRGTFLYGNLSKVKHWIKNKVFNETWRLLGEQKDPEDIKTYLKNDAWPYVFSLTEDFKYELLPFEALNPPIKELYRAMEAVDVDSKLRDTIVAIFQEDDAYRWRFQWIVKFFPLVGKPTRKHFFKALDMMEHAEEVGDMKERIRLVKRGLEFMLDEKFDSFLKEMDWKKFKLTKADKYFFRAKWFRVDYPEYQY